MILRRILGLWLTSFVLFCEIAFLLLVLGVSISRPVAVWGIAIVGPALLLLVIGGRLHLPMETPQGLRWLVGGLLAFAFWGSVYFVVGYLVPQQRMGHLPEIALSRLPVAPAWSLIYVAVHPFSVLPWFYMRRSKDQARFLIAMGIMLVVSVVCWTTWPVATVRMLPPGVESTLGGWVLSLIYQLDPSANCFPSTHCAMAMCVALALWHAHRGLGAWAFVTTFLIALSTLLTRQHYLVDVVAGLALGTGAWFGAARVLESLEHLAPLRTSRP